MTEYRMKKLKLMFKRNIQCKYYVSIFRRLPVMHIQDEGTCKICIKRVEMYDTYALQNDNMYYNIIFNSSLNALVIWKINN